MATETDHVIRNYNIRWRAKPGTADQIEFDIVNITANGSLTLANIIDLLHILIGSCQIVADNNGNADATANIFFTRGNDKINFEDIKGTPNIALTDADKDGIDDIDAYFGWFGLRWEVTGTTIDWTLHVKCLRKA